MNRLSHRIQALDAVRGVALVGIVVANIQWFSGYAVAPPAVRASVGAPRVDAVVEGLLHGMVDGKFYGLFSLLFGVGVAIMADRAHTRGRPVVPTLLRRFAVLGAIGLLHGGVLWFGDIISLYAVAAVPLLAVIRWPRGSLLRLGVVCLSCPLAVTLLLWAAAGMGLPVPDPGGHGPAELLPAFGHGDLGELWAANAAFLRQRWVLALASSRLVRLFGLFVLGLTIARALPRGRVAITPWLWPLAVGSNAGLVVLAEVGAWPPSASGVLRELMYSVGVPSGALLLAALAWNFAQRGGPVVTALAAAGRLSLSHYIGQSVVMGLLFYGVGLGGWGRLGATAAVGVGLLIVGAQIAISPVILRRWSRGPLESLVRALAP